MGTSLSGLTPATTFDGLLKVGDNDPLTAELKAISTGDGTDTILQLSTTALQISGDTTIETTGTWVNGFNSNLRLESDAPSMQFKDTGGTPGFMIGVSGGSTIFYQSSSADFSSTNAVGRIFSGRWSFGVGTDLGASVGIKGSGASALTTSLLVQNSAGTQALKVTDNGAVAISNDGIVINGQSISRTGSTKIQLGTAQLDYQVQIAHIFKTYNGTSYAEVMRITGNSPEQFVGIGETTPTARLHVKGSGNDNTTISLLVQNSDGNQLIRVRDDAQIQLGQSSNFTIDGVTTYNRYGLVVGSTSSVANTRMFVKGSGTTSATTSLLVENSEGTELLKVTDDGNIRLGTIADNNVQLYFQEPRIGGGIIFGESNGVVHGRISLDRGSGEMRIGATNSTYFPTFYSSGAEAMRIDTSQRVGIGETTPTARLHVKGSGNDNTTTSLLVQNSDGTDMLEVDDSGNVGIGSPNPLSATLHISSQSYFNNTTALRIQNSIGNNLFRVRGDGTTDIVNNKYIFNQSGVSTGGAIFKGSGATSATTALLVQNSAGSELLKVRDDGVMSMLTSFIDDLRVNNDFRVGNSNFRASNANSYFQSQYINNVFGGVSTDGDASALVTMKSTTQGFLPPRMRTGEKNAITSPAPGLMVYDTDANQMSYWNGGAWINF